MTVSLNPEDYDEETLELMYKHSGKHLFELRTVTVEIINASDNDWSWNEFMYLMYGVPEDKRDISIVNLEYDGGLSVSYRQSETQDTLINRVYEALQAAERAKKRELDQYNYLRAKFG